MIEVQLTQGEISINAKLAVVWYQVWAASNQKIISKYLEDQKQTVSSLLNEMFAIIYFRFFHHLVYE